MAKKVEDLLKEIGGLSVLELADLVKALEEKFGVSAAPVAVAATPAQAPESAGAPTEEKSTFNVELSETGGNKIAVIKALREINQALGLKEAKDISESPPKTILEGAKKEEAEEAKKKLETAGAKVELK